MFDINNLKVDDAKTLFYEGFNSSSIFGVAERYELSPEDGQKVCDFLYDFDSQEFEVLTSDIFKDLSKAIFVFGGYGDSFKFESEISRDNFDGNFLNVNGFCIRLPKFLTKVEVGNTDFYFGYCSDISYRLIAV